VVGDDVEIDLHVASMRSVDECAKLSEHSVSTLRNDDASETPWRTAVKDVRRRVAMQ
jgi:hypothetical protein